MSQMSCHDEPQILVWLINISFWCFLFSIIAYFLTWFLLLFVFCCIKVIKSKINFALYKLSKQIDVRMMKIEFLIGMKISLLSVNEITPEIYYSYTRRIWDGEWLFRKMFQRYYRCTVNQSFKVTYKINFSTPGMVSLWWWLDESKCCFTFRLLGCQIYPHFFFLNLEYCLVLLHFLIYDT